MERSKPHVGHGGSNLFLRYLKIDGVFGEVSKIGFEASRSAKHNNDMKLCGTVDQIKKGGRIVYNDGRPGHSGVLATVLAVGKNEITVQFDDRADTTRIAFSDRGWLDFIEVTD